VHLLVKKLKIKENGVKYRSGFMEKSQKNIRNIKYKKWSNWRKVGVTQTVLERMENNLLQWSGDVLRIGDNRWPERMLTWSPEGRKRREIP
jgi:hypothetical protein